MKHVLRHIFDKKRAYGGLPLFAWMRDESRDPRERLAFYPCMAYFIMAFGDLKGRDQDILCPFDRPHHVREDD